MGQMHARAGDAVKIRDERWRVAAESSFGAVSILEVEGCDATNRGVRARFLLPFESLDTSSPHFTTPQIVTIERWRRTARSVLAGAVPQWTSLRAAAGSNLAVLPFQLEPAIAVTRGDACRVLIADDVGLGKTVQAGLIIAETLARSPEARILIVAPAGLREQWRDELRSRFDLNARLLDAYGIASISAELAPEVNPWSIHALAVTSIDYVKRPEVLRSLETLTWDVLVFDEAHALTGRSDRATAAAALGRRARVVVMLTATPHSGDEETFSRLCGIGDVGHEFPLMTFRRTRTDIGLASNRRSAVLKVRLTADESAMHHLLNEYSRRLTEAAGPSVGASLLSSILLRRACSSAASLARSVERRITLLAEGAAASREQLTLPFTDPDSDEEPGFELAVPGLADANEEQQWLQRLAALATRAATDESKVRALRRLLRRINEQVIVFTEYRDTLQHIAGALQESAPLALHGGLGGRERADVIRRFNDGRTSLLLATDAASEGLNLHQRCRFVINLEIPWTPLRIEQRVGRVDRIGQTRRVHALNLVAVATYDEVMADRLRERADRIQVAFQQSTGNCGLQQEAQSEASRMLTARRLSTWSGPMPPAEALTAFVRTRDRPATDLRAFRLSFVDEIEHPIFETIAGVIAAPATIGGERLGDVSVERHQEQTLLRVNMAIAPWLELARRRESAMVAALRDSHARLSAALLQPGLFDRRAERVAAAQTARVDEAMVRARTRLEALDRLRHLRCGERRLLFELRYRP